MIDIKKLESETEEQFLWKVGQLVDSGQIESWASVNDIVNKELGIDEEKWRDESSFRKRYQAAKKFYNGCFSKMQDDTYQKQIDEMNRELMRNTIRYRDQRNAWNKQNYSDARIDETLIILDEKISQQGKINFEVHDEPVITGDNDILCMLTDLHIGQTFDSMWGSYNTDIAQKRLNQYLNEILEIQKLHGSEKCYVSLQGDLISGNIHSTIQISNRENVIEQMKIAIELISSFCYELTKHFSQVFLYNVSGNHSRLVESKEKAVHAERLDDFIGWDVGRSLEHIENFHMVKHRNLDLGIADICIRGKSYISLHGDYDSFNKQGVLNLCSMLGFFPYACLYGHMHTPSTDEVNGIKMIRSGSIAGSGDDYTIEKRLCGKPSQTVMVCTAKGIKCIYNVELN